MIWTTRPVFFAPAWPKYTCLSSLSSVFSELKSTLLRCSTCTNKIYLLNLLNPLLYLLNCQMSRYRGAASVRHRNVRSRNPHSKWKLLSRRTQRTDFPDLRQWLQTCFCSSRKIPGMPGTGTLGDIGYCPHHPTPHLVLIVIII